MPHPTGQRVYTQREMSVVLHVLVVNVEQHVHYTRVGTLVVFQPLPLCAPAGHHQGAAAGDQWDV